jgi:hypothetical protein
MKADPANRRSLAPSSPGRQMVARRESALSCRCRRVPWLVPPRASANFSGLLDGKRAARAIAARLRRREELGCQPPAPAPAQYRAWESSPRHARGRAAAPSPRAWQRVPGCADSANIFNIYTGLQHLLLGWRRCGHRARRGRRQGLCARAHAALRLVPARFAPQGAAPDASSTVAGQRHDF